ncbi:MAG: DNA cytosine methyltransferase [Melioribacteraceae bacterium]|nr:DNA cytosine methyltransferase [Melioribacteraceae bacterium]
MEFTVIDLFSGAGGVTTGIEQATVDGIKIATVICAINHDELAIESHWRNHPHVKHFVEDIRTFDVRKLPNVPSDQFTKKFLWASLECFPAGTMILTKTGYKNIEKIKVGEMVLTHANRWKPVTDMMQRESKTVIVKGQGHPGLETTNSHPIYVRKQSRIWRNEKRRWDYKVIGEPEWKIVKDLSDNKWRWATPIKIPRLPIPPILDRKMPMDDPEFWWLIGRWLGDGSIGKSNGAIEICAGKHEAEELWKRLKKWEPSTTRAGENKLRWCRRSLRTAELFITGHLTLSEWIVKNFGKLSHGKKIPAWVFGLEENLRRALLDGYLSADGHSDPRRTYVTTVSKELALGIRLLAESLGHRISLCYQPVKANRSTIEGRKVNVKPQWILAFENNKSSRHAFADDLHSWSLIKSIRETGETKTVYNISIADDESYIAEGIVVHNCTNHSNAKGGLSRDADSRTLAEHLPPYIKQFDPDYIGIENVREFKDWGRLIQKRYKNGKPMFDKHGKPYMIPDPAHKGEDFKRWIKSVCALGYQHEMRMLNAADYGAHTSRKRLFIIFAKEGLPIVWPEPTHDKLERNGLAKWKPVKDVLDFSDKGENIFGRKQDLCENTYKRIYAGLVKFIANGDDSFLEQYNGGDERILSTNGHCNTITTMNRFGLIQPEFLVNYNHSSNVNSIKNPSPTLTTHDKLSIVSVEHFIDMQHGSGKQNESVNEPVGAILPVVKKNLVTVERFIDQQFGASKPISEDEPCNALTANPKYNLVSAFLYNPQYQSKGGSVDDPCFTLIGKMDKRPPSLVSAYLMDTQYGNVGRNIDEPSFSLVASRRYPYLVQLESGQLAIEIEKTDSEYMQRIKMFMAVYGIVAIYMRMLRIPELKRITGFAENYVLEGTQADQKKYIGNAVPPVLPKAIFEALYRANRTDENIRIVA